MNYCVEGMEGYHIHEYHRTYDHRTFIRWVSDEHFFAVPQPITCDNVVLDFDNEDDLVTWLERNIRR